MASSRITGGSDLRARLQAVGGIPAAYAGMWAEDAAARIRQAAPPSQRPASKKFTTKATATRAGVYGAFWWIFVDRGTKAHDIAPRKGKALRFEGKGGETIFARKAHRKRMARRPFITSAAKAALSQARFADEVVQTWNTRRLRSHKRFL